MNTRTISISLISIGLAACGGLEDRTSLWDDPDESARAPSETATTADDREFDHDGTRLGSCEIEPLWWTSEAVHRATPQFFEFSTDGDAIVTGADLFGSGHRAWSAADGSVIYSSSHSQFIDANHDHSRVLQRRYDPTGHRIVVAPLTDPQAVIWRHDGGTDIGDLDRAGERVVHVEHETTDDGQRRWIDLTIAEVETGDVLHSHRVDYLDFAWWAPYGPDYLAMSDDGRHVALGLVEDSLAESPHPRVLLFSQRSGGWHQTEFDVELTTVSNRAYNGQISTITFSPDNAQLVVVSASGESMTVDTTDHRVVERERRGAFAANWDTYLPPLPASPVEWTRDGRLRFSVAPDGALEMADGADVIDRIFAPEIPNDRRSGWDVEIENPAVAVAVGPRNDQFAVAFRQGLGVWGCAGARVSGVTELRGVTATGRRSAESPYRVELDITLEGTPRPIHGYTVYKNDAVRTRFGWDSPANFHGATTDAIEVVVEVRDAFGSVRSQPVRIEPLDE